MEPVTGALTDRMVQAIVDEVDPEQVILFGSRGRGDERVSSDIDLIVVEAEPFGPERSRRKELVTLHHALVGTRGGSATLGNQAEAIASEMTDRE